MRFITMPLVLFAFTIIYFGGHDAHAVAQDLYVKPKASNQTTDNQNNAQKQQDAPSQLYVKPNDNFVKSRTAGQNRNSTIYNGDNRKSASTNQANRQRTEPRNKQLEDIELINIRKAEERAAANNAKIQADLAARKSSRQQMVDAHVAQVEAEKAAQEALDTRAAGGDAAPAAGATPAGTTGGPAVYLPNSSKESEKPARIFNIFE